MNANVLSPCFSRRLGVIVATAALLGMLGSSTALRAQTPSSTPQADLAALDAVLVQRIDGIRSLEADAPAGLRLLSELSQLSTAGLEVERLSWNRGTASVHLRGPRGEVRQLASSLERRGQVGSVRWARSSEGGWLLEIALAAPEPPVESPFHEMDTTERRPLEVVQQRANTLRQTVGRLLPSEEEDRRRIHATMLTRAALASGLDEVALDWQAPAAHEGLAHSRAALTADGSFHEVVAFVARLSQLHALSWLETLELRAVEHCSGRRVRLEAVAHAVWIPPDDHALPDLQRSEPPTRSAELTGQDLPSTTGPDHVDPFGGPPPLPSFSFEVPRDEVGPGGRVDWTAHQAQADEALGWSAPPAGTLVMRDLSIAGLARLLARTQGSSVLAEGNARFTGELVLGETTAFLEEVGVDWHTDGAFRHLGHTSCGAGSLAALPGLDDPRSISVDFSEMSTSNLLRLIVHIHGLDLALDGSDDVQTIVARDVNSWELVAQLGRVRGLDAHLDGDILHVFDHDATTACTGQPALHEPDESTATDADEDASTPRTPLQRHDAADYVVTALFGDAERPLAVVEAPDGVPHLVETGTYIGRNWGQIARVTDRGLLVDEEYRTLEGGYVLARSVLPLMSEACAAERAR